MALVNKRLTDLTEISSAPDDALIHIVLPDDISQNEAGSSYKIKKSNYGGLSDAPSDGETYGRKDGAWEVVGGGDVLTTNTNITSANLATQDVAGFVAYINALNPVITLASNEIRTYTVTDTGQIFEILLRGRSFGFSEPAIITSDVLLVEISIVDLLKKTFNTNNYVLSNGATGTVLLNLDASVTGTARFTGQTPGQNLTGLVKYRFITGYESSNVAGNSCGVRSTAPFFAWNTRPCIMEFFNTSEDPILITATRSFSGIRNSSAVIGNAEPSALVNCIGLGDDTTDTNMQIMHNDATGTCTKVDLGSSFPAKYTTGQHSYRCLIYVISLTNVFVYIEDIVTGISTIKNLTTNLPASNAVQQFAHTWRNNGANASAIVMSFYGYESKKI